MTFTRMRCGASSSARLPRDRVHSGLGRDVRQEPGSGSQRQRRTGREEQPTVRREVRDRGAECEQYAGEIDGQDAIPLVEVEFGDRRSVRERARRWRTRTCSGPSSRASSSTAAVSAPRSDTSAASRLRTRTEGAHFVHQRVEPGAVETDRRNIGPFTGGRGVRSRARCRFPRP